MHHSLSRAVDIKLDKEGDYSSVFDIVKWRAVLRGPWKGYLGWGVALLITFSKPIRLSGTFSDLNRHGWYWAELSSSSVHVLLDVRKRGIIAIDPVLSSEGIEFEAKEEKIAYELAKKMWGDGVRDLKLLGHFRYSNGDEAKSFFVSEIELENGRALLAFNEPGNILYEFTSTIVEGNPNISLSHYIPTNIIDSHNGLNLVEFEGNVFYNYDFTINNISINNIDWPITLLFSGFENENPITDMYFGKTAYALPMYVYVKPCGWITKQGTKGVIWSPILKGYLYLHIRLYRCCDKQLFFATTHYDQYPIESWSGYSGPAAADAMHIAKQKGLDVFKDYVNLLNAEGFWVEENKIRLHNGFASMILAETASRDIIIPKHVESQ